MKHFPDINEIKLLEKNSQKNGSGIVYEELLGIWKFKYVWGKESDEIKNIPSSILQVLSARLELKSKNKEDQINYEIKNSINFGLLNITFIGSAELKGLRPLLAFYFEKLKISISSFPIFNKELKKPEDKKTTIQKIVNDNFNLLDSKYNNINKTLPEDKKAIYNNYKNQLSNNKELVVDIVKTTEKILQTV